MSMRCANSKCRCHTDPTFLVVTPFPDLAPYCCCRCAEVVLDNVSRDELKEQLMVADPLRCDVPEEEEEAVYGAMADAALQWFAKVRR